MRCRALQQPGDSAHQQQQHVWCVLQRKTRCREDEPGKISIMWGSASARALHGSPLCSACCLTCFALSVLLFLMLALTRPWLASYFVLTIAQTMCCILEIGD